MARVPRRLLDHVDLADQRFAQIVEEGDERLFLRSRELRRFLVGQRTYPLSGSADRGEKVGDGVAKHGAE